jgi:Flp pilus assembly protein CpaB
VSKTRVRNLALPLGLAAAAAILIGIYVISYRNSVTHGAGMVKVIVAARDIPAGTDGSAIAGGGYLKSQTVPRRAVVPGSLTSAAPLTSKVTSAEIYQGEQLTLRQFVPVAQGGIFAQFSGNQRVVVVPGDAKQLMAGTVQDGDHVDVVATARYHVNDLARASSRTVLRNLLVLKAAEDNGQSTVSGQPTTSATLVMTDKQAQVMSWVLEQATGWMLVLRPTNKPSNSAPSLDGLWSIYSQGLPRSTALGQVAGNFPESTDAP